MHYKNGRPVELGDFVVGTSHNSNGKIVFGVVIEQMPLQGPCNIRFARIELSNMKLADEQERSCLRLVGAPNQWCLMTGNFDDYGDAANFLKCEDGLRLAKAAQFGKWDCTYYV